MSRASDAADAAADAAAAEDKPDEGSSRKAKRGTTARVNIVAGGENGQVFEFAPGEKLPAWLIERIEAEGRAEKLLA